MAAPHRPAPAPALMRMLRRDRSARSRRSSTARTRLRALSHSRFCFLCLSAVMPNAARNASTVRCVGSRPAREQASRRDVGEACSPAVAAAWLISANDGSPWWSRSAFRARTSSSGEAISAGSGAAGEAGGVAAAGVPRTARRARRQDRTPRSRSRRRVPAFLSLPGRPMLAAPCAVLPAMGFRSGAGPPSGDVAGGLAATAALACSHRSRHLRGSPPQPWT
jgi:hypothetical protein